MTGIGMATAGGASAPAPGPLVAAILFGGSASTPRNYPSVPGYDGDVYTNVSGEYFQLSSTGGVGAVSLSYDITANVGLGFCTNPTHTFYAQAGSILTTASIMTMGWAVDGSFLAIGQSASVTVRCRAVDSVGTIASSPTITVSVTRTT